MRAIVVMFDTLNRRFLPPYGCDWTHAPNFARLARRTATFDNSYVCSMPCMPARREFHTARPNFLHRSWGPMEPFDDSVPAMLRDQGVSTHLISDHYHYWEAGGCTYHTLYNTWEFMRGQEGDPWKGQVARPSRPDAVGQNAFTDRWHDQDRINRAFIRNEEDFPQARTFNTGIDFIRRNAAEDNWLLHVETFDPHEPYYSPRKYKDLYAEHYDAYRGALFDWPDYAPVKETPEEVAHVRHEYASLLSMCDAKLGDVMDVMDEHDMWKDTMLIVWTDHGFMLSEHDFWGKCWQPFYNEIAHTPFFVWDPRCQVAGERRDALVQPALDLGPTLLRLFGLDPTDDMLGADLAQTVATDAAVRDAGVYGLHGHHVNVTDGRYVYMRAPAQPENAPLFEYTLMPTHMRAPFAVDELQAGVALTEPLSFTKGCPVLRIPGRAWTQPFRWPTMLFDLAEDPAQQHPIEDAKLEQRMIDILIAQMQRCDAPPEQYQRLGLDAPTA